MVEIYIILVYDICSDLNGQKILNKTFKTCKKYLTHIQNSVFEGELSEGQIASLEKEIKNIVRKDIDSVIMFSSRNERWLNKKFLGKEDDNMSNFL